MGLAPSFDTNGAEAFLIGYLFVHTYTGGLFHEGLGFLIIRYFSSTFHFIHFFLELILLIISMVYGRAIVNFLVVDGKHSIDLLFDQTDQGYSGLVAVRADKQRENLEAIVVIH